MAAEDCYSMSRKQVITMCVNCGYVHVHIVTSLPWKLVNVLVVHYSSQYKLL